jgi:glutaredoxin
MTHDALCPHKSFDPNALFQRYEECQCDLINTVRRDQIKLVKEIINYRILDYSECNRDDECNIKADAGKTYIEDIEYHYGENNGQIGF